MLGEVSQLLNFFFKDGVELLHRLWKILLLNHIVHGLILHLSYLGTVVEAPCSVLVSDVGLRRHISEGIDLLCGQILVLELFPRGMGHREFSKIFVLSMLVIKTEPHALSMSH